VQSEGDQAPLFLNDVATEAAQAGWLDLAAHAATESAARWLKAGRTKNAADALAIPSAAFVAQPDLRILGKWESLGARSGCGPRRQRS